MDKQKSAEMIWQAIRHAVNTIDILYMRNRESERDEVLEEIYFKLNNLACKMHPLVFGPEENEEEEME